MEFDLTQIRESLTLEQMTELLENLDAEPQYDSVGLICKTICHGGDSHKLYYYENTHLFHCFTGCDDSFDIFELIIKSKKVNGEEWSLYDAVCYVANFFSLDLNGYDENKGGLIDWKIFATWVKNQENFEGGITQIAINLPVYKKDLLDHFPRVNIQPWIEENISKEVCDYHGICYNPSTGGVLIPHYDINDNLIGIRERTLVKENEKFGKYRPAIISGVMYNHPLGFNLYNLNFSKKQIQTFKKAVVFESEKSTLLYSTYFGKENDISVACCGCSLTNYQVQMLMELGVTELIIAFDRQYKEIGDDEWRVWKTKLENIHKKYGAYMTVSFLFDFGHLLDYKDAPIDKGKETFLKLYNDRVFI